MVSTRKRKGGRDAGQSSPAKKSTPDNTKPSEGEASGAGADDAGVTPPSDTGPAAVKEEIPRAEQQGSEGGSAVEEATQGQGDVESESAAVVSAAAPPVGAKAADDASHSGPGGSEKTEDEQKAVSPESTGRTPDGEAETTGSTSPAGTSGVDNSKDGNSGRGVEEKKGTRPSADSAAPGADPGEDGSSDAKPGDAGKPAAKPEPSETTEGLEGVGLSPQPEDEGMVVEDEGGEEAKAVVLADSSSDEEDDGFRVVVGREAPPAAAPVVPTKRFLRGTNTLVNTTAATTAATKDSSGGASSPKPVSAAAGIASLVPSKGAPVAAARPSLKPGEYPPTAELQQSRGRTAFDVDIDGLEEQPWRYPGVDIADFFNYGFTEDSWRVYCEKQLRNRYDRTVGRSKVAQNPGGRGGNSNSGSGHMRLGGGDRPGRMENSLQPQRPPVQMHSNNNNSGGGGVPGPNSFRPQGMAGNSGNTGHWAGAGGGSGRGGGAPGSERFPPGFGPGPPPGHGNASPPWFDGQQPPGPPGPPPPQQQQQQQQHQMREQHRQNVGSRGGRGRGGVGGAAGRGMSRQGMGNGNNNGMMADDVVGGMRGSRSPADPRDEQLGNKMARLR